MEKWNKETETFYTSVWERNGLQQLVCFYQRPPKPDRKKGDRVVSAAGWRTFLPVTATFDDAENALSESGFSYVGATK